MMDLQGYGWMLWQGLELTVAVGLCAMLIAIGLGLLGAWAKLSQPSIIKSIANTYTSLIRGVPELLLILLVYYGAPTLIQDLSSNLGYSFIVDLNPFVAGFLTIGFIYGAFATEVFRGAYLAVPRGQIESAHAIGMNSSTAFRRIILPQMWRFALPGLGNVWMVLIKATALISVIQLDELMRNASIAAGATRQPFTFFLAASFMYLGITIISITIQRKAEVWANRGIRNV